MLTGSEVPMPDPAPRRVEGPPDPADIQDYCAAEACVVGLLSNCSATSPPAVPPSAHLDAPYNVAPPRVVWRAGVASFPSSGPDLFPANVHERGCPSYFRLVPGYTAAYAGVRYVDFADWCRKWGVEQVTHEPVGGAA